MRDVLDALPHFGRQPFAMASVNGSEIGINPFFDVVYRVPFRQGETPIPVGIVSKNYRLVDHHQVLRTVEDALAENGIKPADVKVRGEWTSHGERARFLVILPRRAAFGCSWPRTMKCASASSSSIQWRAVAVSWPSPAGSGFVLLNGIIVGTALIRLRQQHRQQLQVEELGRLLREAVQSTKTDRTTFEEWMGLPIDEDTLVDWIDRDVHKL